MKQDQQSLSSTSLVCTSCEHVDFVTIRADCAHTAVILPFLTSTVHRVVWIASQRAVPFATGRSVLQALVDFCTMGKKSAQADKVTSTESSSRSDASHVLLPNGTKVHTQRKRSEFVFRVKP